MWAGATRYDRIVDGNRELWVPEGYSASQPAACWKAKRDPVTGKTFFVNVAGLGKRWRLPDIHDPDDAAKLGWLGDGATVRKAPAPIPDVPEPLARPSAVTSALHRRESTPAGLEHRSVSKGHGFAVGPEDAAARRGLGPGLGPDATADDLVRQHQSSAQLPDAGSIMDCVRAARADAVGGATGAGGFQNPQGHHHQGAADHLDPLVAARYRRTSGAAGGFADPHAQTLSHQTAAGQATNGGPRHDGHTSRESSRPAGHAAARRGSEPSPAGAGAGRYPNAHVDDLREVDAATRPGAVAALLRARAAQRGAAPLSTGTGAFARPPGLAALEALNGGAAPNAQQQNGELPPATGAGIASAFPETAPAAAAQAPPVPVDEPPPRRPAPTGRFVHLAEDVKPAALMDYDDDVWNRPTKMEAAAQEQARRDIERQKLDDLNAQFAAEAHTRSQQLSVEEQVAIDEVLREQERPLYVPSSAQHRPGPTPGSGHPSHAGRSGSKSNQSATVSSRHTPVASRSGSAGSHPHPAGKGKSPERHPPSGVGYAGHPSAHGSGAFDSGDDSDDYVSPERKALEQQLQGISLSPGRGGAPPPPPMPQSGLSIHTSDPSMGGGNVLMEPTSPPGHHGATTQPGTPTTSTGQPDTTVAGGHPQAAEAAKQDALDALELAHMRVMKESAERVANMVSSPLSATNVNPPSDGQHPPFDGAGRSGLFGDSAEARAALSASPHLAGHRGATAPAALEAAQQQLLADPMNPSSPMMLGYSGILGSSTLGGGTGLGGLAPPSMAADAHHPVVKTAVALAADDVAYHRREIERLRADLELKDRELAAKRLSDAERDRRDLQMSLKMMDALAAYRAQNATIADEEKALEQLHASAATAPFRDARLARTEGRRTSAPVPVGRPGVTIPSTMPSAYIDSDAEGY